MDSPHGRISRARVACRACRQNKIRCGMRNPPCARCSRLNIDCTVDSGYRRTSNRERVQHLEKHVQKLQTQLDQRDEGGAGSPQLSRPEDGMVAARLDSRGLQETPTPANRLGEVLGPPTGLDDGDRAMGDETPLYTTGSVSLRAGQVDKLFSIFFKEYHPVLPFLDEHRSSLEYYRASQLLFWSIVAVAARHFQEDLSILTKLVPVIREQLILAVASGVPSVPLIQSLLLHSCWPMPNYRFFSDPSLLNANIALTFATQLGLHMPHHEQEYTKEYTNSTRERRLELTRTWIACLIQSHSLATDIGLPPFRGLTDSAVSVSSGVAPSEIPPELYHNLLIQECNHRALCILFGGEVAPKLPSPESFFSKMEVTERSFDSLEETIRSQLSFSNTFNLATARLYCQCLHFLVGDAQDERRRNGVLRAYSTARELITLTMSHHSAPEALGCAPAATPRIIFMAAVIIFRVVFSSYSTALPAGLDRGTDHVLFSAASLAIHHCSVQRGEKDLPARMTDILKILWQGGLRDIALQSGEPTLSSARSRFGASVLFDTMSILRSYKEGRRFRSQQQGSPQLNAAPSPNDREHQLGPSQTYATSGTLDTIQPAAIDPLSNWEGESIWNFLNDFDPGLPGAWDQYGMI